jgi:hypothetical protein
MLYGIPPFYHDDPYAFRRNVCSELEISFPTHPTFPPSTIDLLSKLLRKNPCHRFGNLNLSDIESHAFFTDVDWTWLTSRERVVKMLPRAECPIVEEIKDYVPSAYTEFCGIRVHKSNLVFQPEMPQRREISSWLHSRNLAAVDVERIVQTISLRNAVSKNDITTAKELLSQGAHCNFESDDSPEEHCEPRSWSGDCEFGSDYEFSSEDFMPPLVLAIVNRNEEMVELLLEYGSDVNAAYHELHDKEIPDENDKGHVVPCGTVVQLAIALENEEITRRLIDAGADLCFTDPPDYRCPAANRMTWHRVVKRILYAKS